MARSLPAFLQQRLLGRGIRAEGLAPCIEDAEAGDHAYTISQYRAMFSAHSFSMLEPSRKGSPIQSFVLTPV